MIVSGPCDGVCQFLSKAPLNSRPPASSHLALGDCSVEMLQTTLLSLDRAMPVSDQALLTDVVDLFWSVLWNLYGKPLIHSDQYQIEYISC